MYYSVSWTLRERVESGPDEDIQEDLVEPSWHTGKLSDLHVLQNSIHALITISTLLKPQVDTHYKIWLLDIEIEDRCLEGFEEQKHF